MSFLKRVHHIALICSDHPKSKQFYTDVLGFKVEQEVYRPERQSYKTDLSLNGVYTLELFSFPHPPARPSRPEATGLRHLAFEVDDLAAALVLLQEKGAVFEAVRIDEYTGKRFTFLSDPDGLPIELYEK
jgi:glyoxylase I family protein